jgi:hypothetical protein
VDVKLPEVESGSLESGIQPTLLRHQKSSDLCLFRHHLCMDGPIRLRDANPHYAEIRLAHFHRE